MEVEAKMRRKLLFEISEVGLLAYLWQLMSLHKVLMLQVWFMSFINTISCYDHLVDRVKGCCSQTLSKPYNLRDFESSRCCPCGQLGSSKDHGKLCA